MKQYEFPRIPLIILVFSVLFVGFNLLLGNINIFKSKQTSSPTSYTNYAEILKSYETPSPTPLENVVYIGKYNDKWYAKYNNQVFYPDVQSVDPRENTSINPNLVNWTKIIQAPSELNASSYIQNEIFGFVPAQDNKSAIITMSWDTENDSKNYMYRLYKVNLESTNVTELNDLESKLSLEKNSRVPRVQSLTTDEKIHIELFGCWYCGGHYPETALYSLVDTNYKNIGKVSDFAWTSGKGYKYKDYVAEDCKDIGPGDCYKDPSKLPWKYGLL